jgi:(1->4)-alpha-D-glucan 1-alpha-D-glucosylmutase
VSLPGSGAAYPNWRRRQPLEVESWDDEPGVDGLLAAVRAERGVSIRPSPPPREPERAGAGGASIPRATYRLQLHAGFGFAAAAELVPYLSRLGVSDCYFSPYLQARPGSTHGYDVIAHDRLNPELGSRADYERLCETLADHGMGKILDMVPNHVGVMGAENHWWLDVLENGPGSTYADFFDIDWEPLREELRGKVLLPVLGDHYGNVLDSGELVLVFAEGAFRVEYYEHHFPIDPREYPLILAPGLDRLRERLGEENQDLVAFASLITAFGNLPPRRQLDADALVERRRDKELHKRRLAELCDRSADLDWVPAGMLTRAQRGRRLSGRFRSPARLAGGPGLPLGPLAGRRRRDQLPALLRHQRPGRSRHGECRGLRGDAPSGARPGCPG